jgi:pimeloyl-ACP methyl ester carboxylesterase
MENSIESFKTKASTKNTDKYVQTSNEVSLYLKDYGEGKPVILIHGWPMSSEQWEYQIEDLVKKNHRVIAYDRRGFGKSSKPWNNYDYDTLADDLHQIIIQLDLNEITLVGFSMGGGEVARYLSRYKEDRIIKAVLVSSVVPFLLKTEDNPDGNPKESSEDMAKALRNDRLGFLKTFGENFFGIGMLHEPMSDDLLEYYKMLCSFASPRATLECATAFATTDFREEIKNIKVPVLIIHGSNDQIVPLEISSAKAAKAIPNNELKVYEDAPHGLFYTHREQLSKDLLHFLEK